MNQMWSRRAILGGLVAGAAAPVLGQDIGAPGIAPATSLFPRRRGDGGRLASQPQTTGALIEAASLGGAIGFVLADAASGAVIEAHDPDRALPPASVMKALTAAYALDRLGPEYRYATRVLATGPVSGGRIEGDIILAGGGDPVLDTDMLGDMVARIAQSGISGASGRLLLWDGALPRLNRIDDEQPVFVGYNPAISGLNLNFNRVHFEWRRAGGPGKWTLSMDARAGRYAPAVHMARASIAPRETPLFTYETRDGIESWTVASAALGKGGARWLPVRQPALYAGEVFRNLGAARGLALAEAEILGVPPTGTEIGRHDSAPLATILRDMLRHSTNLTAEVAGMTASHAATHRTSAIAMREWARIRHGVPADIADHSGLGGGSRITAAGMVRLLVGAQHGALPGLLRDHGFYGPAGDRRIEGHPVLVRAKTGTLNFTSALAGYITPPGGRRLVFAIFAADPGRRARLSLAEREAPAGGVAWNRRARRLQNQLIARWTGLYA